MRSLSRQIFRYIFSFLPLQFKYDWNSEGWAADDTHLDWTCPLCEHTMERYTDQFHECLRGNNADAEIEVECWECGAEFKLEIEGEYSWTAYSFKAKTISLPTPPILWKDRGMKIAIDHSKCHCPDIEARAKSMPCEEIKCYIACGGKALEIAIDLHPVIHDEKCDRCGKCAEACPCEALKLKEDWE